MLWPPNVHDLDSSKINIIGYLDLFLNTLLSGCFMKSSSGKVMNWWWIVFVVWLIGERRLALFPTGTIVRDPHHRETPTRRTGFEPGQNLISGFVE